MYEFAGWSNWPTCCRCAKHSHQGTLVPLFKRKRSYQKNENWPHLINRRCCLVCPESAVSGSSDNSIPLEILTVFEIRKPPLTSRTTVHTLSLSLSLSLSHTHTCTWAYQRDDGIDLVPRVGMPLVDSFPAAHEKQLINVHLLIQVVGICAHPCKERKKYATKSS
jgi:hypothetical protein